MKKCWIPCAIYSGENLSEVKCRFWDIQNEVVEGIFAAEGIIYEGQCPTDKNPAIKGLLQAKIVNTVKLTNLEAVEIMISPLLTLSGPTCSNFVVVNKNQVIGKKDIQDFLHQIFLANQQRISNPAIKQLKNIVVSLNKKQTATKNIRRQSKNADFSRCL
jgi:hypothetical protein